MMHTAMVEFRHNDPLRMAGATAFFATFALPPILVILVLFFGLFVDRREFAGQIMTHLAEIIGQDSVTLIRETIRNVRDMSKTWYQSFFILVFLCFIATTLFVVIRNSVNQIWGIRVKPRSGFRFKMLHRLRSFGIIVLAGLLFSAGLLLDTARMYVGKRMDYQLEKGSFLLRGLNELIFAIIVTIWFTVLFRFLTDGRPKWRMAIYGGIFTAILFTAGKLTIRYFLMRSNIQGIYNASGSFVLLLLFVFYSAMIFYYGACFVKVLSEKLKEPIRPVEGAYMFTVEEVVTEESSES